MSPLGESDIAGGGGNGPIPGPYDEIGRAIAALPRPRRVRMSRRGKLTAAMVAAVLLASVGLFVSSLAAKSAAAQRNGEQPQLLPFTLPIVFIVVIVPVMLFNFTRQKPLLAEGEIATARVIKRQAARHGPRIQYEFTTPLGENFKRSASDGPGQLQVGMSVPVFYDSQTPKKQLALCASLYEIVMLGEE
jgi:hypothetical protein